STAACELLEPHDGPKQPRRRIAAREDSELLHDPEPVDRMPGLVDLPVDDVEHVLLQLRNPASGRGDATIDAEMGTRDLRSDRDEIAVADHLLDRDFQVRKAAAEIGDELLEAVRTLECLGPARGVKEEVGCDDLVGELE